MKKIISGLCAVSIFFSTVNAFVTYEIPIREEKIIPINFVADQEEVIEYIDLSEYEDVEMEDYKMNTGKVLLEIEDDEVILDLYDGEFFDGETVEQKVKTEKIEDLIIENDKAVFVPEEEVINILDVGGDFVSGIIDDDKIILELAEEAQGTKGYDESKIVKSNLDIRVDESNSQKTLYSDFYEVEEMPDAANVRIKNVNLTADAEVDIEGNKIRVLFDNGNPQINETSKKDGYGYYWIDRALDGTFREKYPNSIYRTDRYYFEGRGEYITDERLIMEREFEENWKDYVGFVLGNQRYVYLLSDISKEVFNDATVLTDKSNNFKSTMFSGQEKLDWMNTDELTVEITDNSVKYIPKGNLYSMGELVAYSEGWGETIPNKSDESTESFFNNISGRMETYVKHFKFFYGPKEKITFGGSVTYPYKATVEYEHYQPTTLYNGEITYTYHDIVSDKGYKFDGWMKISYLSTKTVNDYPPNPPYNVVYNKEISELAWQKATDDYTKAEDMVYEVEIAIDEGFSKIGITNKGETKFKYENGWKKKFRVRAIDNQNQFSEWAYSDDTSIEITAKVEPQEVFAGESIDIFATVRSLNNIKSVQAYSEELKINEEMIKVSTKISNAVEVSFNLLNHAGISPWLIVDDMAHAVKNDDKIKISTYFSDAEERNSRLEIELPNDILVKENGTIIVPNQNYADMPIEITSFNDKLWYFYSMCGLTFINKNTGNQEDFVRFVNDNEAYLVGRKEKIDVTPYIKINLFDYSNGVPQYEKIAVPFDIATKPIAVSWITQGDKVKFSIYIDGKYFYSYEAIKDNVFGNIEKISTYELSKRMERMLKNSVGYQYHYKDESYTWSKMYKAGTLLDILWLGYKIKPSVESNTYDKYNNLETTRDVNRLAFFDEQLSENAIELYLSKIKSTNMMIDRKDKETMLADDVCEIISEYITSNIKIDTDIKEGRYNITITAIDELGQMARIEVPVVVKEKAIHYIEKEDIDIGRYYYSNNSFNEKYVEELSLTKHNLDTKGFISAGETLAIVINSEDKIPEIIVDFVGDKGIKEYDKLTQKFLGESKKYDFPLSLKPTSEGVFLYTIPYGTKQTLESWATLRDKSQDFENIDKALLFSRISSPYQIKILINDEEFIYEFDVFERWDTIINRNASPYVINSAQKWRIKL